MKPITTLLVVFGLAILYSSCKKSDSQPAPPHNFTVPMCGSIAGEGQFEHFNDSEKYWLIDQRGYFDDETPDNTVLDSISVTGHDVNLNTFFTTYLRYKAHKKLTINLFMAYPDNGIGGTAQIIGLADTGSFHQFDLATWGPMEIHNNVTIPVPAGCYRLYYVVTTQAFINSKTVEKVATKGHFDISIQ